MEQVIREIAGEDGVEHWRALEQMPPVTYAKRS
jgi:hypothetical protein